MSISRQFAKEDWKVDELEKREIRKDTPSLASRQLMQLKVSPVKNWIAAEGYNADTEIRHDSLFASSLFRCSYSNGRTFSLDTHIEYSEDSFS